MTQENANFDTSYLLGKAKDGERLKIQHEVLKPSFDEWFNQILDKHGLAQRLSDALSSGAKIRILDFGCGEGLYLHDVAQILQERQLLQAAELIGMDLSPKAIAGAKELALTSNPAWPQLKFYVHNGVQPLAECEGLYGTSAEQCDLIYAQCALQYLPNARQNIERIYREELKPGGVLFIREPINKEGTPGWKSAHPALRRIHAPSLQTIINVNGGIAIGLYEAAWLKAAGATVVAESFSPFAVGGSTLMGQQMLRNMVLFLHNSALTLIERGIVTQNEFDDAMADFEAGVRPESEGVFTLANTLALKPV